MTTSDRRWPMVRQAPLRLLLRSGSLAVMILAAVALLAGLVSAGPLYEAATSAGGLSRELAAIPATAGPARQPQFQVTETGDLTPDGEARAAHLVDTLPGVGNPVTALSADAYEQDPEHPFPYATLGDRIFAAVLYFRTGALQHLQVVSGTVGAAGLWLPQPLAAQLGVRAGSRLSVGKTYQGTTCGGTLSVRRFTRRDTSLPVTVAGVYRTRADGHTPAGDWWTPIASGLPTDPAGCFTPASLLIGDRPSIDAALSTLHEKRLWTYKAALLPDRSNPAGLAAAAGAANRVIVAANEPGSPTNTLLGGSVNDSGSGLNGPPFRIDSGLPDLEKQAVAQARAAAQQGRGIAYAGAVIGLAALVVALRALAARRRREAELLLSLGTPTWVVVATAVLELLLPALIGAGAGWAVELLAVTRFGPQPELAGSALVRSAAVALLVAAVALAGNALVVLGQVLRIGRELSGRPPVVTSVPWLPVLTGMTALALYATLSRNGNASFRDPLAPLLPILVLACGCALLVRIVTGTTGVVRNWRSPHGIAGGPVGSGRRVTDRLVVRGLRRTGVAVADLVIVLAVGIAVLGYGLVSSSLVHEAVDAKASVLAGANSSAEISGEGALNVKPGPAPHLPVGQSVVWRASGSVLPDTDPVDVMVIDPRTFASTALFRPGRELGAARRALAALTFPVRARQPLPAVLVGPSTQPVGSTLGMLVGTATTTLRIGAHVDAFPGATGPTLVVDARSYLPRLPAVDDPTRGVTLNPYAPSDYATWLWSTGSLSTLRAALDEKGVLVSDSGSLRQAAATPVLTSSGWASSYQVALGVAAAVLAGLAVVVAVDRRVARAAPADLVLRRFGVGARRLLRLRTRELALTCLAALAALALPLAGMIGLVPRLLEPDPGVPPELNVHLTPVALLLTVVAAVAVTAVAALAAARRSAAINAGEVLRDDV